MTGRLSLKTALPVALPLLAFGLFSWFNVANYGELPRFSHATGLDAGQNAIFSRFQGMLLQVGGASVFPLLMAGGFMLRRRRWLLLPPVVLVAALLAIWQNTADGYPPATTVLFTIFLTAGSCMVLALVWEGVLQLVAAAKRLPVDREFLFLSLWLALIALGIVVLLPHTTAKYFLPIFAPLILLLFREVEAAISSQTLLRWLAGAAIGLSFITGLGMSAADYQLAQAYKNFPLSIEDRYHPTGQVWFVGEWGFRHYMETKGYRYLTSVSTAPEAGDLIVRPTNMDWPLADSLRSRMKLMEVPAVEWGFPLRVMSIDDDAGFYGSYWGQLPYTFTRSPVERFEVYRVVAPGP
jgi:hypothetical protein